MKKAYFTRFFITCSLFISSCSQVSYSNTKDTALYEVSKKDLNIIISETAEIASETEISINAPFSTKLEDLVEEGSFVKKGDLIGRLSITRELEEKEKAELSIKESEIDLKIAELENKREIYRLENELKSAELAYKIANLNLKKIKEGRDAIAIVTAQEKLKTIDKELKIYELDIPEKEKLYKSGYLSEDELIQTKTKYNELKKTKEETKTSLKVLESGPLNAEIEKEEINSVIASQKLEQSRAELNSYKKISELNIKEKLDAINYQKKQLDYYSYLIKNGNIIAPVSGIIIYGQMDVGREEVKIKAGDTIKEGVLIAKIIDTDKPMLKLHINEIDVNKLKEGQKASFFLDAYPEKEYSGELIFISKIASIKYRRDDNDVKVFEAHIRSGEHDKNLKSGMTANVEIITSRFQDVISVPSQTIINHDNKSYCYVMNGEKLIKREIKAGASNELNTIISSGLQPGEKIALKPYEVEL